VKLSGGQRQRIAIAWAVLANPKIFNFGARLPLIWIPKVKLDTEKFGYPNRRTNYGSSIAHRIQYH